MLENFKSFIGEHKLFMPNERILLAVSGGIDSIVMLDLFHQAGFRTGMAHCNFRLRGVESDGDEEFVKARSEKYGLECHVKPFDTKKIAEQQGISIQMAARNLRYAWFEEIRKKHRYAWVATAHNQDDVMETFFINLSRGTGIRGLTGIPPKAGRVIRPLLFSPRSEIQAYAGSRRLDYREDSSNASDKYLRNKIRHQLIPALEKQNPSFRQSMIDTMKKLKETSIIYHGEIEKLKKRVTRTSANKTSINIAELLRTSSPKTLLYEILAEFNFNTQTMEDILRSLDSLPGRQFFSSTHRIVKDREQLILTGIEEADPRKYYIELSENRTSEPVHLEWVVIDKTENFKIPEDPEVACLDLDLLDFPLILRHWQKGDYFQPLGMQGMKKLSDYMIDKKIPLPDKAGIWLLATGNKIVWVAGHRIDDRFKVTAKTRQILMIRYKR